MPRMIVAKPFLLTRNNGDRVAYGFGVHEDVPAEDAEHPYAQHFIAPNGKLPEPAQASPLTHEERVSMKASLDEADERVRVAEDRASDMQRRETEREAEMETLRRQLAVAQAGRKSAEADLEKATRPAPAVPVKPGMLGKPS